ncbi:hypothetical protein HMPREF1990_02242 [Porphyromonas gingivalis W4087]|uniref:Uncharacterized protein n=1 Tax=Porphyromonas gingivalis F0570 TaxID=1227271 RepID=A0A0E2LRF7_PORGN|nr:hypothetical protein A343_0988 [Porphyromonas gingivalis JCVI SC001]ERJ65096.1 hypothetical protein HMPREF1554_01822 [Porphyromonas gingivalis F0569]ERJ67772.1 hypothetical protein HMPREF1555_00757 [Porphyromonas gingivalis F0570]ERJ84807.1 hypothetical protein HMPREF1988_00607 [Porphyromonas gingivalis F0185]ERJ85488.1 hypothetical protein HMPREF1990_02242 [Porphyromonas gingivalis W4087]OWR78981.1 hypothetical protein SJDPG11_05995 [Porphyromonas gingivalis SJD11]
MTDMMIQTPQGEMEMRLQEQEAVFVKKRTGEEPGIAPGSLPMWMCLSVSSSAFLVMT